MIIDMKKIFILILLFSCASYSYSQKVIPGQINREDLLKGIDNASQVLDKSLLMDAVSSAFFLSRQSFQVADKKTGELYGLNNQNEFGKEITLGVKAKEGFLLTDKAIRPWEYNSKFNSYRDGYKAVPSLSEYTEQGEKSVYDSLTISIKENEKPSEVYYIKSNKFNGKGLGLDIAEGSKNGWIVWAYADKEADLNQTAKLSFVCCKKELVVAIDSKESVLPPKDKNILGGVYIVPNVTEIGVVNFLLCGIITDTGDKWNIVFPFVGMKENNVLPKENNVEQKTQKDNLTPVEDEVYAKKANKKRNKKSKK